MANMSDDLRYRGCERKLWFKTQAQAENAIVNMATYVYHCRFCDGWHLATKRALAPRPPEGTGE